MGFALCCDGFRWAEPGPGLGWDVLCCTTSGFLRSGDDATVRSRSGATAVGICILHPLWLLGVLDVHSIDDPIVFTLTRSNYPEVDHYPGFHIMDPFVVLAVSPD